ncbi:hypothetical protein Hanom_Chr08g00735401 [Helianthus anomalus]
MRVKESPVINEINEDDTRKCVSCFLPIFLNLELLISTLKDNYFTCFFYKIYIFFYNY